MANLDLSKVKKEHLVLISIILSIFIFFAAYKNVFSPLLGKIKDVNLQIEQRKMNIQKAKVSPQSLKALEDEIEGIKTKLADYESELQASIEVPQMLKEFNQMAERLKIKIVSVNPLEERETLVPGSEQFLLEVPIRIKLQCGYHEVGVFINQIENSPRFMRITELKINASPQEVWTHQAELVVTSYKLVWKK